MAPRLDPEIARRVLAQSMNLEEGQQVPLSMLREAVHPARFEPRHRDHGVEDDAAERRLALLRAVKNETGA